MLRAILVFLDTQCWPRRLAPRGGGSDSETDDDPQLTEIKEAGEYIISQFREPLDEIEDVVLYGRKYLSIGTECYLKIWYKLHKTLDADAIKCLNVLRVCEFSLRYVYCTRCDLSGTIRILAYEKILLTPSFVIVNFKS